MRTRHQWGLFTAYLKWSKECVCKNSARYSGRTQKQIVEFVRENYVKRQTFQRNGHDQSNNAVLADKLKKAEEKYKNKIRDLSQSFRHSSSAQSSVANVGTSISAHPLLPLGDNAVAGTPASLSCGSMTLTSSPLHTADIHAGGSPSPPLTTSVSPGTSVTSSPQHFYPQETPYRHPGHPPTRLKHPHVQSLRTTSPLQSPTTAATAANIRSANHTNNNVIDDSDIKNSRINLRSPESMNFNDIYSNCYSSLRNLQNVTDNVTVDDNENETKTDVSYALINANSKSNESIKSSSKKMKTCSNKKPVCTERNTWYRSASCKDLYHDEESVTEKKNEINIQDVSDKNSNYNNGSSFQIGFDSPITRYDDTRGKCYSAVVSKTPSIDRTGEVITDMKIYSSSYPGTTSSLSTESAEGEPSERIADMIDGSQEEMVLSHDDISHDSYDLLEREFDDYDQSESSKSKSRRVVSESDRARSCSWGSDRGLSPLDSRSSEKGIASIESKPRESDFRSLDRGKNGKYKSEIDFRSLDRRSPKHRDEEKKGLRGSKTSVIKGGEDYYSMERKCGRRKSKEVVDYDSKNYIFETRRRSSKDIEDDVFRTPEKMSPLDSHVFSMSDFDEREFFRNMEPRQHRKIDQDNMTSLERRRYQERRKSSREEIEVFQIDPEEDFRREELRHLEERRKAERKREKYEREERFHEGIKEKEEKELEKRRRSIEEKRLMKEDDFGRKNVPKPRDTFEEIEIKKFDRVVSNQFGRYSEFLTQDSDYELMLQERKVLENYEKVCQVGRMAKELERNERAASSKKVLSDGIAQSDKSSKIDPLDAELFRETKSSSKLTNIDTNVVGQFKEFNAKTKGGVVLGFPISPKESPKLGKLPVGRTKSDPYDSSKNSRRNVLMHQKSIDLTPQDSGASDYNDDAAVKKTSRSEHDIPYILHKRHCMNGTAKGGTISTKTGASVFSDKPIKKDSTSIKSVTEKKTTVKKTSLEEPKIPKPRPSSPKIVESKLAAGIEIINMDIKEEPKKPTKTIKSTTKASEVGRLFSAETPISKEKKQEPTKLTKEEHKKDESLLEAEIAKEPIYAQVNKGKVVLDEKDQGSKKLPPEPPKRISSVPKQKEVEPKPPERTTSLLKSPNDKTAKKIPPEPPKRITSLQKGKSPTSPTSDSKQSLNGESKDELKRTQSLERKKGSTSGGVKNKADLAFSGIVPHKREESLILFARTRLGLSEGSAFTPVMRQGHVGSPTSQRRTKSLDAPVVSVHRLPPADAFSSKDDTVDVNEDVIVKSAAAKAAEFFKVDLRSVTDVKPEVKSEPIPVLESTMSTEADTDTFLPDEMEIENFKETIEIQSKVEVSCPEEKVLDVVRSKRLLSKIDSVDAIDSEGDLDSSKHAEPLPIPPDRLVNLPESVRFPSVRQISGQTSEESADGWDPKEVKVKRRTPRRSVGREEPDTGIKESVVWGSKDEEQPDDDVWDDNLVFVGKNEGPIVNDVLVGNEYLKRGSCGQSIDDDNLSTPMKESSPEHWVSVDDLPEALEREERLLREQEKILREKILNEKLKRELNLDTIDVEDKLYEYRDSFRQSFDDVPLPAPPKDKFKGHSLDTYELTEKKLREKGTNKNPSLDEHILRDDPFKSYLDMTSTFDMSDKSSSYENVPKIPKYERGLDCIKCKVVNDVNEIDQFGDNDEDLEEFVVVLDENLGDGKEGREVIWDENSSFRTLSKEESLISVPEEFKDVEDEVEEKEADENKDAFVGRVEIRLGDESAFKSGDECVFESNLLEQKLKSVANENDVSSEDVKAFSEDGGRLTPYDGSRRSSEDPRRLSATDDAGRLSPYDGSRRGSEERRRLSASDDTGRLSPYDYSSRRSSEDPRRLSASDDAGRLSPYDDSRRGSEDPRRLSTSEDSRRYSISEDSVKFSTSISEETRRRLSSTEETRRKRASLTKQCSVGVDSLSDDMIPGIQECSSSFEQDEKDVFESATVTEPEVVEKPSAEESIPDISVSKSETSETLVDTTEDKDSKKENGKLEIEVSEDKSDVPCEYEVTESDIVNHLAPPKGERELSRETEDSVDYGEEDFKEIREAVKEKDISDGLICDNESIKSGGHSGKLPSSFEKSESSEGDELRFIDDKRGNTPEIIVGKGKETAAFSVVVVNEGISVLNKIVERDRLLNESAKSQSLPRDSAINVEGNAEGERHTLPKRALKPKPPITPKPDYVHRKLTKVVPNLKLQPSKSPLLLTETTSAEQVNLFESSQDSSQESDVDRLCEVSFLAQIQSQIGRRNLYSAGKSLRRDVIFSFEEIEKSKSVSKGGKTESTEKTVTFKETEKARKGDAQIGGKPEGRVKDSKRKDKQNVPKSGVEEDKIKKTEKSGRDDKVPERSPDQEKRDSGEDVSSSSSAPPHPKRELSSTWRPFLLESSGSSSLEEGWLPPDDNAHLADEEETSSTSNNQQDDSYHDDVIDYPTSVGYPVLNLSSAEMMVGGYGSVFSLSRTLSRISERSTTSEQEKSDIEDDITKPSSHSVSIEEESIFSSDHQPSLSSDPPSPKASTSKIPDLPHDRSPTSDDFVIPEDKTPVCEPFDDVIPPPLPDDDWPSPPTSSSMFDTPVVSHIETFYMEIHPEEAYKVVVSAKPSNEDNSSSDENQTLHEEGEFLHLSSDNLSISTTTTTQDGTVIVPVRPNNQRTNSVSEDTSVMSISDWSSSVTVRPRTNSNFGTTEDLSDWTRSTNLPEGSSSGKVHPKYGTSDEVSDWSNSSYRRQSQPYYSKSDEIASDNLGSRSEWQPSTKSGDTSQGVTISDWSSPTSSRYPESCSDRTSQELQQKPKVAPKPKPLKLKSPTAKNIGFFETPVSKVRSPTSQSRFFEKSDKSSKIKSPTSYSETTSPKNYGKFFENPAMQMPRTTDYYDAYKTSSPTKQSPKVSAKKYTGYYSNVAEVAEKSYFGRYDTGSLERTKIQSSRKCLSYYSMVKSPPSEDDSSNQDPVPAPASNTIPRASKKSRKRHRVAMDLQIRDGKIVAPPKTRTTVLDNSDSDKSSHGDTKQSNV